MPWSTCSTDPICAASLKLQDVSPVLSRKASSSLFRRRPESHQGHNAACVRCSSQARRRVATPEAGSLANCRRRPSSSAPRVCLHQPSGARRFRLQLQEIPGRRRREAALKDRLRRELRRPGHLRRGRPDDQASRFWRELRLRLAKALGLIDESKFCLLWVVDFPLLEWHEEAQRFVACHHPFTSPHPDDLDLLETNPGACRAVAYDIVLNGLRGRWRRPSASTTPRTQSRMFGAIGIGEEEAPSKFGFLLERSGLRRSAPRRPRPGPRPPRHGDGRLHRSATSSPSPRPPPAAIR